MIIYPDYVEEGLLRFTEGKKLVLPILAGKRSLWLSLILQHLLRMD